MDPGQRLSIERYDDAAAVTAAGWDALVAAAGAPVFYQAGYLHAYQQAPLAELDRQAYLVVRAGGAPRPVAVLPVAVHRRADPIGGLRRLHPGIEREPALLSHVWHCYDSRLVGAATPAVARAVLDALRELAHRWRVPWYGLVNVARGGPTSRALAAAGLPGAHLVDRYRTDLSGAGDLDGYLDRLGPRARANLRRNARRAAEAGIRTSTGGVAGADLAGIAELCARTAARLGNPGFYPPAVFSRFVTALGPLAHVLEVRQHGRLVAAGVCLTDERRFHTWTCGVDYAVAGNASPYAVLFAESVALALRLGRPVLEGGRSNEVFKRRHGLAPRALDAHVVRA